MQASIGNATLNIRAALAGLEEVEERARVGELVRHAQRHFQPAEFDALEPVHGAIPAAAAQPTPSDFSAAARRSCAVFFTSV